MNVRPIEATWLAGLLVLALSAVALPRDADGSGQDYLVQAPEGPVLLGER